MPAALKLQEFGNLVLAAFGNVAYQVGSSMEQREWHDVDVRVILGDEEYAAQGYGRPDHPHANLKWRAMCLAFSALGREMTGLPIDFQVQQQTTANKEHEGVRSALFTVIDKEPTP